VVTVRRVVVVPCAKGNKRSSVHSLLIPQM
jgi:hypothetical protein